jgi:hypothetical protein
MRLRASKKSLNTWAVSIIVISLVVELIFGYRVNEASGWFAEMLSMASFLVASLLIFSPRGHQKPLVASLCAFIFMIVYGFLHPYMTTSLDVSYGGPYAWSATRTMVLGVIVGPSVALLTAVAVFIAAKFKLIEML